MKKIIHEILNNKRWVTYNLTVENRTHNLKYDIYGAKINHFKADQNGSRLVVSINSITDGIFIIKVPRDILDGKKQLNGDTTYTVFVDGENSVVREIQNSNDIRTLAVELMQGNKEIEILGAAIADSD